MLGVTWRRSPPSSSTKGQIRFQMWNGKHGKEERPRAAGESRNVEKLPPILGGNSANDRNPLPTEWPNERIEARLSYLHPPYCFQGSRETGVIALAQKSELRSSPVHFDSAQSRHRTVYNCPISYGGTNVSFFTRASTEDISYSDCSPKASGPLSHCKLL